MVFRIIARIFFAAKLVFMKPEIYDDILVLVTTLVDIVLILVFAEKFMNMIRRPFKSFNLKIIDLSTRTKIVDKIVLCLMYFVIICSGEFLPYTGFRYPELGYVIASYLVVCPPLYLACILLTKFLILAKYMICPRTPDR
jgi:hypothetical protein